MAERDGLLVIVFPGAVAPEPVYTAGPAGK